MVDWFDHALFTEGWITDAEALFLYRYAKECKRGCIVEIGSYKGKSTQFLAAGSRAGFKAKVYAIDPHDGGEFLRNQYGRDFDTYKDFYNNLVTSGLVEYVEPIVATSENVAKTWSGEIGLIFIDGSHIYEDVKMDAELWSPHVIPGGIIAIHDAHTSGNHPSYPGPRKVAEDYLKEGNLCRTHIIVDTTVIGVKK